MQPRTPSIAADPGALGDAELRLLFDQSPTPYLVLRPDQTIAYANDAYLLATMTRRDDIVGLPVFGAFPTSPDAREAERADILRTSLARVAANLDTDFTPTQRYDIRKPDGSYVERYWSGSNTAVLDRDGKLAFILCRVEDVTEYVATRAASEDRTFASAELEARFEQTKAQSAARQHVLLERISADRVRLESAVHAKDEFLQIVSHELKAPIATILGNAAILRARDAELDEDDRQWALRDIEFESVRLNRILDNLLLLARPELGVISQPELSVLDRTVERAVADHRRHFPERPLTIEREAPEGVLVEIVSTYLEQILQNLLANAEKYSPAGGPIIVKIESKQGMAHVSVMDSGKGFTPEQAAHVFETYYRIADERSVQAGIGIGLAVCKRLVEVMGGSIRVGSQSAGGGVVEFTLALAAADEGDPHPGEDE